MVGKESLGESQPLIVVPSLGSRASLFVVLLLSFLLLGCLLWAFDPVYGSAVGAIAFGGSWHHSAPMILTISFRPSTGNVSFSLDSSTLNQAQ